MTGLVVDGKFNTKLGVRILSSLDPFNSGMVLVFSIGSDFGHCFLRMGTAVMDVPEVSLRRSWGNTVLPE